MIYLLFLTVTFLLIIAYFIFDHDIIAPSVVLCATYLISTFFAVVNVNNWGINYHFNTYFVLVWGIIVFILGELVNYELFRIKRNRTGKVSINISNRSAFHFIHISVFKWMCFTAFTLLTLLLYVREVYRISLIAGNTGGFTTMMSYYNYAINYMTLTANQGVGFVVTQMFNVSMAFSYIILYAFINNIIINSKKKRIWYLVPVIIFLINTIYTGSRSPIMSIGIFSIVISYILYHQYNGWSVRENRKIIQKLVVAIVIFIGIFIAIKQLVGRTDSTDGWNYISGYIGGSIQLFDIYMQNPPIQKGPFGAETFFAIYNFLNKYGFSNIAVFRNLEFHNLAGTPFNVYTAFRRYIQDFGIAGMVIPQILMAFFYSNYYYHIKLYKQTYSNNFKLIIYGFIFYPIVLHPFDETFFSSLISVGILIQLISFYIIYRIIIPRSRQVDDI